MHSTSRSRFVAQTALLLVASAWFAAARATPEPRGTADDASPVPVDTSRLMGSPSPLPPFELEPAFPALDFERPLVITHAGDGTGRLFVGTQRGEVYVFPERAGVEEARLYLDIRDRVKAPGSGGENEEGLMGLAFHPRYEENGELFVYYTRRPLTSVIARFRRREDDPDRADPDSEERLLEVEQPYWNHNGGCIRMGPDGKLYIPFGDGGSANDPHGNGQDLSTLLGTILRIDVDHRGSGRAYAVPPDNPFVDREGARGEIWAFGLRNVWGMHFDRETGTLWAADVGQNLWEEVDIIRRGGNYGWKVREGLHPFAPEADRAEEPFIDPVWEYHHDDGKSITGGTVYRGERLPELRGWYVCADYVSLRVWAIEWRDAAPGAVHRIAQSPAPLSAFGEGEDGELYAACFDGKIYRFERRGETEPSPEFPRTLSATGLFESTGDHEPAPGLIPYSVNVPLWSDGAAKERWIALPEAGSVTVGEHGDWGFPVGTVLVKTFSLEGVEGAGGSRRRLETRLLIHKPAGWAGHTYRWNDAQTDAELLATGRRETFRVRTGGGVEDREWYYPSPGDCLTCHTKAAGFALGLTTPQMNRHHGYPHGRRNQLRELDRRGAFASASPANPEVRPAFPAWRDAGASVGRRARAYLDANCAMCHAPGGPGNSKIDLRWHVSLEATRLLEPGTRTRRGGPPPPRTVVPGDPAGSELLRRMRIRGPGRMPIVATSRPDTEAIALLEKWIEGLGGVEGR